MIPINWKLCESMAEIPEQEKLEEWAKLLQEKLDRELNILEIGSYKGQSTALLGQFGKVMAIDLWSNVNDGLLYKDYIGQENFIPFIQNMIGLNLIERVFPIVSTSKFLDTLPDMNFDIIYIDASHQYKDVVLDIARSIRHLSNGGFLAFDDYKRPGWKYPYSDGRPADRSIIDPWVDVARAIDELLATGKFKIEEHYLGKVQIRRV